MGSLQISQPSYQNLDQGFVGEPGAGELHSQVWDQRFEAPDDAGQVAGHHGGVGLGTWNPVDFMTLIKVIFCMASQDENLYSNF